MTPGGTGRIFVQRGNGLVPVRVKIGLVADTQASVTPLRGTLSANDQVVIGDNSAGASGSKGASAGNPLAGGNQRARPAAAAARSVAAMPTPVVEVGDLAQDLSAGRR